MKTQAIMNKCLLATLQCTEGSKAKGLRECTGVPGKSNTTMSAFRSMGNKALPITSDDSTHHPPSVSMEQLPVSSRQSGTAKQPKGVVFGLYILADLDRQMPGVKKTSVKLREGGQKCWCSNNSVQGKSGSSYSGDYHDAMQNPDWCNLHAHQSAARGDWREDTKERTHTNKKKAYC